MSDTQLDAAARGRSRRTIADEVIRINTEARPLALQVALLVPAAGGARRAGGVVR